MNKKKKNSEKQKKRFDNEFINLFSKFIHKFDTKLDFRREIRETGPRPLRPVPLVPFDQRQKKSEIFQNFIRQ